MSASTPASASAASDTSALRDQARSDWRQLCEWWTSLRHALEGGGAVMVNRDGSTFIAQDANMVRHYEKKGLWRSGREMAEHTLTKGPPTFEEYWEAERQHLEMKAASDAAWKGRK